MKRAIGEHLEERVKIDGFGEPIKMFEGVDIYEYIVVSNGIARASTSSRRAYAVSEDTERRYFATAKYDSPLHTGKAEISYVMSDGLHPDTLLKQASISERGYGEHLCYVRIPYRKSGMSDEDYMAEVEDELEVALAKQHIFDCIDHDKEQKWLAEQSKDAGFDDDINYN